jgi:hypothetical protein
VVSITASSSLNGHDHLAVDAFSQAIGDSTGAAGQDIIDPFRESLCQFLHRIHVSMNDSSMPIVEESRRHAVDVLPVSPSLILASLFGCLSDSCVACRHRPSPLTSCQVPLVQQR